MSLNSSFFFRSASIVSKDASTTGEGADEFALDLRLLLCESPYSLMPAITIREMRFLFFVSTSVASTTADALCTRESVDTLEPGTCAVGGLEDDILGDLDSDLVCNGVG